MRCAEIDGKEVFIDEKQDLRLYRMGEILVVKKCDQKIFLTVKDVLRITEFITNSAIISAAMELKK
jgi:hypothetical protein